jgi:hypothetical protein
MQTAGRFHMVVVIDTLWDTADVTRGNEDDEAIMVGYCNSM